MNKLCFYRGYNKNRFQKILRRFYVYVSNTHRVITILVSDRY